MLTSSNWKPPFTVKLFTGVTQLPTNKANTYFFLSASFYIFPKKYVRPYPDYIADADASAASSVWELT